MSEKRYSIVKVDRICPTEPENLSYDQANEMFNCNCGNDENKRCKNYGDTKEQLIKKVAQVLFRRRLDLYKLIWGGVPSKTEAERYYEVRLEIAKEIVEFLGVE